MSKPSIHMPHGPGWGRVPGFHLVAQMYLEFLVGEIREQHQDLDWRSTFLAPVERTLTILEEDVYVHALEEQRRDEEAARLRGPKLVPGAPRPVNPTLKEVWRAHVATLTYLNLTLEQINAQVVDPVRLEALRGPIEQTIEVLNDHTNIEGLAEAEGTN